jgi:hypothetical protein
MAVFPPTISSARFARSRLRPTGRWHSLLKKSILPARVKLVTIAPTTQDPFDEQPTIEKVQRWNRVQLLEWIRTK